MSFLAKISLRSIQNKRLRTLIVYATILVSTFLLTLILVAAIGIVNLNKEIIISGNMNYHARINNLNSEAMEGLKNDPLIGSMLTSTNIAKVSKENINIYIVNNNVVKDGITQPAYVKGHQPVKVNDMACSEEVIDLLDIPAEIGTRFILPYRVNNEGEIISKEFVLCGILESSNAEHGDNTRASLYTYSFFASEDFLKEQLKANKFKTMTAIRLNITSDTNYDELNSEIDLLFQRYSIEPDSIVKNVSYLKAATKSGIETILLAINFSAMTVLFSCVVLYSVYSALTPLDTQNIGRFRILGADYKQTKKILYFENLIIALAGLISGMALGYAVAFIGLRMMYSKFTNITFPQIISLPFVVAITVIILLGTMFSLRPVVNRIISVPPNQALHFNNSGNTKVAVRKSFPTISINKLVKIDVVRNRKNVRVSIIIMGVSCILFVAVSALFKSASVEEFAKTSLPRGDFLIKYNYAYDDKEYSQNNLNTKQLSGIIQEMEAACSVLPGIDKIEKIYLALGDISYPNTEFVGKRETIGTFSKEDINYLNANIERGKAAYDDLSEKPGIIYTWGHAFDKNGFKIGDEVTISFLVGNEKINKTFILIASTNTMSEGTFLVPENVLKEVFAEQDAAYALALHASEAYYYDIKQQLNEITGNKGLSLICIDEEVAFAKEVLAAIKYPILLVCIFIGIIGFVTITNTMLVSMISRQKEISLYRCLGLTSSQLFAMLFKQISVLVLSSVIIALPLGNLIGFILVGYAKQNGWIGINAYSIPLSSMAAFTAVMFLVSVIMTVCIQKFLLSKSAIERLRAIE